MLVYTSASIAIFMNTPPDIAGIVGGIFNSALQLGIAIGVSAFGSIAASVESKRARKGQADPSDYHGAQAVFWFVIACLVLWMVCLLLFYRVEPHFRKGGAVDAEAGTVEGGAAASEAGEEDAEEEKRISMIKRNSSAAYAAESEGTAAASPADNATRISEKA